MSDGVIVALDLRYHSPSAVPPQQVCSTKVNTQPSRAHIGLRGSITLYRLPPNTGAAEVCLRTINENSEVCGGCADPPKGVRILADCP